MGIASKLKIRVIFFVNVRRNRSSDRRMYVEVHPAKLAHTGLRWFLPFVVHDIIYNYIKEHPTAKMIKHAFRVLITEGISQRWIRGMYYVVHEMPRWHQIYSIYYKMNRVFKINNRMDKRLRAFGDGRVSKHRFIEMHEDLEYLLPWACKGLVDCTYSVMLHCTAINDTYLTPAEKHNQNQHVYDFENRPHDPWFD